ncbi:MAG: hypothetical protein M1833_001291 [Piccolia ochrophora]|nr:MAG: hypothetical protein M1833_001291 [Piccolia ochrophora]
MPKRRPRRPPARSPSSDSDSSLSPVVDSDLETDINSATTRQITEPDLSNRQIIVPRARAARRTRASTSARPIPTKDEAIEVAEKDVNRAPSNLKRRKRAVTSGIASGTSETNGVANPDEKPPDLAPKRTPNKTKTKAKRKAKNELEHQVTNVEEQPLKKKRKRKTKEEKEAEAMPLAARTAGLKMRIGAHVSSAKGVHNSVTNCLHIGGNAFALFLKSQRKWENPALKEEHATQFITSCHEHKYDAASHVVPHGSYLVNLAQKEPAKATQAFDCFLEDLQRCEQLGIRLYNIHPGSTGTHPRPEAIGRIAAALNRAHQETSTVKVVLENMAGGGNIIGSTFEDLRGIIALIKDKSRIGVCLDTCHAFAAGYDLRTSTAFKDTLKQFDEIVGLKYLSAMHINDSKAPFASHRDLHQNIGLGFLGLGAFHNIMNEKRFEGLPLVLETPIDREGQEDKRIWATEIKLLESLIGLDRNSKTFLEKETELAAQGGEERKKHQEAYERKLEKIRKAAEKEQSKQKKVKDRKPSSVAESEGEENTDTGLSSVPSD